MKEKKKFNDYESKFSSTSTETSSQLTKSETSNLLSTVDSYYSTDADVALTVELYSNE